nr:MAG TPA: hypothetical protein [Caudoviricetes sp.]
MFSYPLTYLVGNNYKKDESNCRKILLIIKRLLTLYCH